jgi:hypothetical protein
LRGPHGGKILQHLRLRNGVAKGPVYFSKSGTYTLRLTLGSLHVNLTVKVVV